MNNNPYINKALEYISNTWNDDGINLDSVAGAAGFSNAYFDRMFAENTGKSVMEYVRTYKLIRSAHMLRTSEKSILNIALDLGYSNPENYTRAFKAIYSVSPAEYRQKNKNISLTWNDMSTGTVIKRFEQQFPEFRRVCTDDLVDYLLASDPVRYAADIVLMSQIDCAVYKLSDNNEYIYVAEYRPDEMCMTLYCRQENIGKYISLAKQFNKFCIDFRCDSDYALPEDDFGFSGIKKLEFFDFAYLKDEVKVPHLQNYSVRLLSKVDRKAVERFDSSAGSKIPTLQVFEQKYDYGNYVDTLFLGLFFKEELVGIAMPSTENGQGLLISDIGGITVSKQHKSDETITLLWSTVIEHNIVHGEMPLSGGTTPNDEIINNQNCRKMGYKQIAKRYSFTNIK